MTLRIIQRLVAAVACLAVLSVASCSSSSYTAETSLGGRPVIVHSSQAGREVSMKVFNDTATIRVGGFQFTVDRTHVTWGENQTLALPSNWKRVEFIDDGTHIAVRVDGSAIGEIRPTA